MSRDRDEVVIATRGSPLARWQSDWVADRLREADPGRRVTLRVVKTTGDRFLEASLQSLGGKGAFTKEITEAVLSGEADVAVHSLKDLPTASTPGLRVWAYPARFDPRDAWMGREGMRFSDLSPGSVVATGSLRRRAQVLHRHPGTEVTSLRGNVGTRLRKFEEGEMAGMVLALAGLERLGLGGHVTEVLEPSDMLGAPGQGSLAVEGRDDARTRDLLDPLDDADTRTVVVAERAFLAELEAGCQVPVAALARIEGTRDLILDGLVSSLDGTVLLRDTTRGPRSDPTTLGRTLARSLLDRGGRAILDEVRRSLEAEE